MDSPLTHLTLVDVADEIASARACSVEVTEACLARIEAWQPALRAFISVEADDALRTAYEADRRIADGRASGPLHGVPLAHKDMFYRAGKVSTCGSRIRADHVGDRTATVIERLVAAGALYLGGLNMAEFAAGATGHNDHYGDCANPWDRDRVAGGSSSGSAAAVAARLVYGALGSDTGGSIRLPASMCGVTGLKPTHGRVSRYGAMPRSWSQDTFGPIARTVRDCARLFDVIAGPDPRDRATLDAAPSRGEQGLEGSIEGLRVGVPVNYFYDDVDAEVCDAVRASIEVYASMGARIMEIGVPDLTGLTEVQQLITKCESASAHGEWLRTRREEYSPEVLRVIEAGLFIPAVRYLDAIRGRGALLRNFDESVFGRVDVLHAPVVPGRVPPIARSDSGEADHGLRAGAAESARLTQPVSYLGLPALGVPAGFTSDGLPVGFQLIGPPFAEEVLLRAGHAYQRHTDWHTRVPDPPPATARPGAGNKEKRR